MHYFLFYFKKVSENDIQGEKKIGLIYHIFVV